jgi:hypothetical protein
MTVPYMRGVKVKNTKRMGYLLRLHGSRLEEQPHNSLCNHNTSNDEIRKQWGRAKIVN